MISLKNYNCFTNLVVSCFLPFYSFLNFVAYFCCHHNIALFHKCILDINLSMQRSNEILLLNKVPDINANINYLQRQAYQPTHLVHLHTKSVC